MSIEPKPVRDLLITAIETNNNHGVGIILQRMFGRGEGFVCLRTTSQHGGHEPFGSDHHELCSRFLPDAEAEQHLRAILALYQIRRILVVPYYREEFVHATIAKRLTGAPLCTYLMDDQNVFAPHVPDRCVREVLEASDLRLAISPEMCAAYRAKFGHEVHLLPPLAEPVDGFLPNYWHPEPGEPLTCAMLGNIWTERRFAVLRRLLCESKLKVHWYGNGPKAPWLSGTVEEWEADGIEPMGFLPEEDLVAALGSYPFVLVPSGSLEADDDNPAFSRLSLPSRLVFLHARTSTPVLLLGSPETAAGRFIQRLGSGLCASHTPEDLVRCAASLVDPAERQPFVRRIHEAAPAMSMPSSGRWLWESMEQGEPQPARFTEAFGDPHTTVLHLPTPSPTIDRARQQFLEEFAVSRLRHFAAIPSLQHVSAANLELTQYIDHVAAHLLDSSGHALKDVLFLGEIPSQALRAACGAARLWRIKDLTHWQAAGFSGDAAHLECLTATVQPEPDTRRFDAIISAGWLANLPDSYHAQEGLSLFLAACIRPGGINAHWFSAVLHPAYFWASPTYGYLVRRFCAPSTWPGLDAFLHADDSFFMSESAYDSYWRATVGKAYNEFGRPFALMVGWLASP
ncbi:MAG: hypothetical protein QM691_08605 [Opitutaceae bacterium]